MAVTLGSNSAISSTLRRLSQATASRARSLERLATGQRINRPSDDAAGIAVTSSLEVRRRVYLQGVRNFNDGISVLSVADGALSNMNDILTRQRELATQAANGTFSASQRGSLNTEAQKLYEEYRRLIESTTFNGMRLLDGSLSEVSLQGGFGASNSINVQLLRNTSAATNNPLTEVYNNFASYFPSSTPDSLSSMQMIKTDINGDGKDDLIVVGAFRDSATQQAHVGAYTFLGNASGSGYTPTSFQSFDIDPQLGFSNLDNSAPINFAIRLSGSQLVVYAEASFLPDLQSAPPDPSLVVAVGGSFGIGPSGTIDPFGYDGHVGFFITEGQTSITNLDLNGDGIFDSVTSDSTSVSFTTSHLTTSQGSHLELLYQQAFLLDTQAHALSALDLLTEDFEKIQSVRGRIGAGLARIDVGSRNLSVLAGETAAARSRIMDADVAEESANLVRTGILQEISTSILAHAKLQPALVLDLLKGI